MLTRPTTTVITAIALCLGLAACSSGSASSSVAAAVAGGTDSATPTAASSTAEPTTASPSAPSPGSTTSLAAVASGGCSMIDQTTAEGILGFSTKPGLSAAVGGSDGSDGMKKLDGCVYESLASGSLGYDVAQVSAQIGAAMLGATKARLAAGGASVSPFDPGIANSTGFTQTLPHGVDSQIWLLVGDRLISVASTRKDGDVTKSRAAAIATAEKLAAHS
jgi:hypothetical protein